MANDKDLDCWILVDAKILDRVREMHAAHADVAVERALIKEITRGAEAVAAELLKRMKASGPIEGTQAFRLALRPATLEELPKGYDRP